MRHSVNHKGQFVYQPSTWAPAPHLTGDRFGECGEIAADCTWLARHLQRGLNTALGSVGRIVHNRHVRGALLPLA